MILPAYLLQIFMIVFKRVQELNNMMKYDVKKNPDVAYAILGQQVSGWVVCMAGRLRYICRRGQGTACEGICPDWIVYLEWARQGFSFIVSDCEICSLINTMH